MAFNTNSFAQFLGNEWINYSQKYYKFPVTKTSIYHIDSTALSNAGIPVISFDARNIQLFFRGMEVPLYVQGENDGVLNGTDFIEFFGEANDGWLDSAIYINGTADMMNPAYSLFNDTSFYYLTWNNSIANLRYTLETDIAFASYSPSPYYIYKARKGLTNDYYGGEILSAGVTMPEYTAGEGYCKIYDVPTSYTDSWLSPTLNGFQSTLYTGGVNSFLKLHVATCNNPNSSGVDHHHQIDVAGNLAVLDTSLEAYNFYQRNFTVNSSALQSSSEPFRVHFLGTYSPITRNAFGYYELTMPQIFDLSNRTEQSMYLPDDGSFAKSRVDITNFNAQSSTAWIFDLTNRKKITTVDNAGTLQALIPNDGNANPKRMYLSSDAAVTNITQLSPVSTDMTHYAQFRDFQSVEANKDYIVISHKSLWNSANLYENLRSYRYNSMLIDIEELYDQFGFGIRNHPASIRNFLKMTNTYWSQKPEYLFLIGKSIKHNSIRTNTSLYAQNLLPTMGISPCDNMFAYDIDGSGTQYCAIGRIATKTDAQVIDYYNKVLGYEAAQNVSPQPEWMKNVLHFSSDPLFEQFLEGYRYIIEDTLYGAHVTNFFKQGGAPFGFSTAQAIRNALDTTGVSIVTIFGHSSGSGFDQIVDDPEDMHNYGKYPLYIVNGCLSGDLFQAGTPLISERYVLTAEKGAIAFMASSSIGFSNTLYSITSSLYNNIGVNNYNEPMGLSHKNAISDNVFNRPSYDLTKVNALDFQLHGDPGLITNTDSLPDLDLQVSNVSFNPPVVTTDLDSFKMKVIVTNLGRTINQSYQLQVTRDFPEPGVPDYTYTFNRPFIYYKDTVEFYVPVSVTNSFGNNIFTITVDIPSQIEEMSGLEIANNIIQKNLIITSSDILPVYPYKYAVIPHNHTPLKASTGDPFAPARNYKFELDTTDLFNSPFLRDTIINQIGGVVQWNPGLLLDSITFDSAAYFWRVGIDSANTGIYYKFKESTFQFIQGKYGWGQDHFFQFKDDDYLFINYNRPNRTFDFVPDFKELHVKTYPSPNVSSDPYNQLTKYDLDGIVQEESGCISWPIYSALYVFVIDPVTMEPWKSYCPVDNNNSAMGYGSMNANCGCHSYRSEKVFMYTNLANSTQYNGLNALIAAVPDNYYIGAYTFWSPNFSDSVYWNENVITTLESIGADTVRYLRDNNVNVPYIFYTIKGNPSTAIETIGSNNTTPIEFTTTLQNQWKFGSITSEIVGPASNWTSFHWQVHSLDAVPANDSAWVRIYGIDGNGNQTLLPGLLSQIPITTTDIYSLNTLVDANQYPQLKLYMYTRDDSTETPSQIDHWHVMYEGVPECALNPNIQWNYQGDTTYQGQNVTFNVAIENIGDYDMDSLQIRYSIVDANNVVHDYYVKRDSLRVGQFLVDSFSISNANFPGLNSFYVEANPYTPIWQMEQFHFNNIGSRNMMVNGDVLNPLLDVTFDGIHIMSGDIVSGRPLINIQLKDENSLRLLDDTTGFELYLQYPGTGNAVRINFANPIVTFSPAITAQNYAKIELRPDFTLQDGVYQLMIRAKDKSGNISGVGDSGIYDYKIKFEVVNHSSITNIFNYPNPFSTSTQWVFTLTGSEIPTEFTIRIMTISGVVVREITLNELGSIHVGNNVSSFKWNGTDEYGDKLATGVYIYQVITKINGEVIDHRNTSADKYFKNSFGKLYILR